MKLQTNWLQIKSLSEVLGIKKMSATALIITSTVIGATEEVLLE